MRQAVVHSRQKLGSSERRTCQAIGLARSTLHYNRTLKDNEDKLRLALIRLAKQYGRYGTRKVGELLRVEGWCVNHKKIECIWREEGLQLPQRHKKRKRLYHHDASVICLRPKYPNHIWAIDFVHDKLSNGRPYKMLTALDEYTREALCVTVAPKMGSAEVLEALYPLLLKRGKPEYLRSDKRLRVHSRGLADLVATGWREANPHHSRLTAVEDGFAYMGEWLYRAGSASPTRRAL